MIFPTANFGGAFTPPSLYLTLTLRTNFAQIRALCQKMSSDRVPWFEMGAWGLYVFRSVRSGRLLGSRPLIPAMDVDQPVREEDPALIDSFHKIMDAVEKLFEADPGTAPLKSYFASSLPGALLAISFYMWEIMERPKETLQLPLRANQTFLEACISLKGSVRRKLYWSRHGSLDVPVSWNPDSEFTTASLQSEGIVGVDDFSFLKTPSQMILMRLLARIATAFRTSQGHQDRFQADPLGLRLFALRFSYGSWESNLVENASLAVYAPLVAYHNYLEHILEESAQTRRIVVAPLPPNHNFASPYPSPATETSLKPAFAVLSALENYMHAQKLITAANLDFHLKDFHAAHAVVCRDHSHLTDSPYAREPNTDLKEQMKIIEAEENMPRLAASLWFDTLCEVSKSAKLVRKRHFYVGWEELDYLFRVAWAWKTLPSAPSFATKPNPILLAAAFLSRWSRHIKPEQRMKVSIKITEMMLGMCDVAEDASAKKKLVASSCLPRLLWLMPVPSFPTSMPPPDPITTILLLIPDIVATAPALRHWFMNSIFTALVASQPGSQFDAKRNDFEIEASLTELKQPAPRSTLAAHNTGALAVSAPASLSAQSSHSGSDLYKDFFKGVPDSLLKVPGTATEMLHWLQYRPTITSSRRFASISQVLAQQIAAFPEAVPSIIDATIENCIVSKVPLLALFLKVAMTHLRVSQPLAEQEPPSQSVAANSENQMILD